MVGWYCPDAAAGRPGVRPLWARPERWTSEPARLATALGSREVKRFSVFGWDGRRVGSFPVAGAAKDSKGSLAIGSYLGASPCDDVASVGQSAKPIPVCQAITAGCGLAVGPMEDVGGFASRPYDEAPEHDEIRLGAACIVDETLVFDTDGDGKVERFGAAGLLNNVEAPSELSQTTESSITCAGSFAGVVAGHDALVRIAAGDFDGDGRYELVLRRGKDDYLLYSAPNSPARLELQGQIRVP